MKIIATVGPGGPYIAEVTHTELEKYLDLYYNKLERLQVGQVIDLGKGYDFHKETMSALKKTEDFISANKDVIQSILNGITLLGNSSKGGES